MSFSFYLHQILPTSIRFNKCLKVSEILEESGSGREVKGCTVTTHSE